MTTVIGLDLSLTSTGLALIHESKLVEVGNIKSKGKKTDTYLHHLVRIQGIAHEIDTFLWDAHRTYGQIDLAVLEGPSYGSSFGSPHERAGLWWKAFQSLAQRDVPIATVAPTTRAKYITGSGRADKKTVLAHAIEAYVTLDGPRILNDDVADAAGLAAMGSRHLGKPIEAYLPATNLEAMKSPVWPV